jgi:hypothetical protein
MGTVLFVRTVPILFFKIIGIKNPKNVNISKVEQA